MRRPARRRRTPKLLVLQDGKVYWLGESDTDVQLRHRHSHNTGTAQNRPADAWTSVRSGSDHGEQYLTDAHDNTAHAWSYYDDAATVHWTDQSGTTRNLEQHAMDFLSVEAVAGPYVFLELGRRK